ncbi:MAG: DUF374 domain-containing protein [Planctomycetota bacterium]
MVKFLSFFLILYVKLLERTCRLECDYDPRDELDEQGITHIFAGLHAHQIAIIARAEAGTGALVSRSKDGEFIANILRAKRVLPIRGSSGPRRKGGITAFRNLVSHVETGAPAYLAVDGPKGPRGKVHAGAVKLSQATGAPILAVALVPRWRIVITAAWDRIQIPLPFSKLVGQISEPIFPREGEPVEHAVRRIELELMRLEKIVDPKEAVYNTITEEIEVAPTSASKAA